MSPTWTWTRAEVAAELRARAESPARFYASWPVEEAFLLAAASMVDVRVGDSVQGEGD